MVRSNFTNIFSYLFSVFPTLLVLLRVAFEATDFFLVTAGDSEIALTLTLEFATLASGIFGDTVVL